MKQTATSFFILDCSEREVTALPERAASGRGLSARILTSLAVANESLEQATARLIRLAGAAYDQRRFDELQAITAALEAIPHASAERAATYYRAVLLKWAGQAGSAAEMLATVNAPRALLTLGTIHRDAGRWTEATRCQVEAMRAARFVDPYTFAASAMQLATARAIEGDHAGSLHDFQRIAPMLRAAGNPALYAIWYNSLAVELAEVGRADEARQAEAAALASPVAPAYPEFEETAAELAQVEQARAAVAVVEPKRSARRRQIMFIIPLVTHHSSLVTCQSSVVSSQYPVGSNAFIRTRAAPRASPRAPPVRF